MNKTVFGTRRIILLFLSLLLTTATAQQMCVGAGADDDNKIIYKSTDAWPWDDSSTEEMTNDDSVWQFLYRNNSTAKTDIQYVPYSFAGKGNSEAFAAPAEKGDGTYD